MAHAFLPLALVMLMRGKFECFYATVQGTYAPAAQGRRRIFAHRITRRNVRNTSAGLTSHRPVPPADRPVCPCATAAQLGAPMMYGPAARTSCPAQAWAH